MEFTVRKIVLQTAVKAMEEFAVDLTNLSFFCYHDESVMMQAYGYDKDYKYQVLADVFLTHGVDGTLEHYSFSKETPPLFMGLKVKHLIANLELPVYNDGHFITVKPKENASTPMLEFTVLEQNLAFRGSFSIPVVPLSDNDQFFSDESFISPSAIATMSAARLTTLLNDHVFCKNDDYVRIGIPCRNTLRFTFSDGLWWDDNGQYKEYARMEVDTPYFGSPSVDEIQPKYLKYFLKDGTPISDVTITLGAVHPVVAVQYNFTTRDHVKFYFAQREKLIKDVEESTVHKFDNLQLDAKKCTYDPSEYDPNPRHKWYHLPLLENGSWGMFTKKYDRAY